MLVPSMNNKEITQAISKDFAILENSSTIKRLLAEYDHERKRAKVKSDDVYTKFYDIKTKAKNTWIIRISKINTLEKYYTSDDAEFVSFIYYKSEHGIRVFSNPPNGDIVVFNRHLFDRYEERMNLNIPIFLDIVKCFLKNNFAVIYNIISEKDGNRKFFGLVTEGFMMGEYSKEDRWYVNKTFISKATSNFTANAFEIDFLKSVEDRLRNIDTVRDRVKYLDLLKLYRTMVPFEK